MKKALFLIGRISYFLTRRQLQYAYAALLALIAAPALASTIDEGWPPLRYRHDTRANIHFVAPELISGLCDDTPNPPDVTTLACSAGYDIWAPNPCGFDEEYARWLCHEIGHVNGWSDNHPGSRSHK